MSKKFEILRIMVGILLLTVVLCFIPVQGNLQTSLLVSVGVFVLSVVIASVLMFLFRRGKP